MITANRIEIEYPQILLLVQALDAHLEKDTRHFYNRRGELLTRLNEVIEAILSDDLVLKDEAI